MSINRRDILKIAGAVSMVGITPSLARAQVAGIEKPSVNIAVGGQA